MAIDGRPATILIVDDEAILRETLAAYLEDHGFVVELAENGSQGLERMRLGGIDLVLLDLRMPEMDGLEVLQHARAEGLDIPVVVVSGTGVLEDAIEAVRRGAWDYLVKPVFDMAALRHVIDKTLEKARLLDENRRYQLNLESEVAERTKDLRAAQARLVEQNRFLRTLLESVPNPIFYRDMHGRFLECNDLFADFVGAPRTDISGKTVEQLAAPAVVALVRQLDEKTGSSPARSSYEYRYADQGGEERDFLITASGFPAIASDPGGLVAVLSDVTAYRRLERQLVQAKEAAEAANTAKSAFLANMSHELRTPLSGILGMLQLLASSGLDTQQTEWATLALGAGRSLVGILSDILDLARIEVGQLVILEEAFDLEELINEVVHCLALEARKKKLELLATRDADVPRWVCSDSLRIRQILLNVMGNAVKFTASGRVALRVSLASQIEDAMYLFFAVSDTGIGIPENKLDTIFDAFSQVDVSYAKRFGGVGLGLSIVRRLVSMLGGQIMVESEIGKPGFDSRRFVKINKGIIFHSLESQRGD